MYTCLSGVVLELEGLEARRAHVDPEQCASQVLARALAPVVVGRGDKKLGADKLDTRDILGWQVNLANQLAFWGQLEHTALSIYGVPHVAIFVDPMSIGFSRSLMLVKHAMVRKAAVFAVVIIRVDEPSTRVSVVHDLAVRRPAQAVRDLQVRYYLFGRRRFRTVEQVHATCIFHKTYQRE